MKKLFTPVSRKKPRLVDASRVDLKAVLAAACISAKTRVSEKILTVIDNDLEISRLEIDPFQYDDPRTFAWDYSLVKFLSKYKGLDTGIDTTEVALSAFRKQEEINRLTNLRLKRDSRPVFVDSIIHRARTLIANTLGPFGLQRFEGHEDWGPGATTDLRRSSAYLDSKMLEFPIPVTLQCRRYLVSSIEADLHWSAAILGVVPSGPYSLMRSLIAPCEGSNIVTVDKNAKTDRTIAIEPRGNMFLQKAVGKVLRRLLRRVGVDLDDQSLNQYLASVAQQLKLATIDLSMASDSVTTELIYLLLPLDWAMYLDDLRSKTYKLGDEGYQAFTKFSSMGNGFTFELESLVFWALAKASCFEDESSATISVYGDDIIIDQQHAHVLISTLNYFGFSVNSEKSFVEGRFFESCGRHYFDGIDVTPFFQKKVVDCEEEVILLYNRLARWLIRNNDGDRIVGPWLAPWSRHVRFLHRSAPRLPFGTEGDNGYLVNHATFVPTRYKRSYGYQWQVVNKEPVRIPADDSALYAYTLRRGVSKTPAFLGISDGSPYEGMLESRTQKERVIKTTRWIEPTWEFALD